MVRAGFDRVEIALRRRASEENLAEFARAVRLRITSQLIAISDADYQAGLAWIEAELRQAKGRVIAILNKWCLIKVVGDKAG